MVQKKRRGAARRDGNQNPLKQQKGCPSAAAHRRGGDPGTGQRAEADAPTIEPHEWPHALSGSPSTIRTLLEHMTDAVGADEVIIQNLIEDPEARIRSHELITDGMGLSSQQPA